ncbi:TRAP transporter small permease [Vreelandella sp. F11]|uniref:TRAP transporter small permease n=1 Tax=Vreelandella sp. F11 TaxID=3394751 RepID=UPI0036DD252A
MRAAVTMIQRIDRGIAMGVALAASCALAIAVGASFWQVLGRFVFQAPSVWSEALTRLALVWMVLLGCSVAMRRGAFVAIDLAKVLTSGRVRRSIELVTLLSCLTLFATLFWFGWEVASRVRFQQMAGLDISMSWGYAALPVGAVFAMLGCIVHFLEAGRGEAP